MLKNRALANKGLDPIVYLKTWKSIGESNPSSQDENLMS